MTDRQFSVPLGRGRGRAHLDSFGAGGSLLIEVDGKPYSFTWGDMFGPLPVDADLREVTLGPKHKFWRAASLWNLQGKRVENGRAIWHEPRRPVTEHIDGTHHRVIEPGEVGHDW